MTRIFHSSVKLLKCHISLWRRKRRSNRSSAFFDIFFVIGIIFHHACVNPTIFVFRFISFSLHRIHQFLFIKFSCAFRHLFFWRGIHRFLNCKFLPLFSFWLCRIESLSIYAQFSFVWLSQHLEQQKLASNYTQGNLSR